MASRMHRFGPLTFDSGQRILHRKGKPVPLVPKTADRLHALMERRGRVASKAELMKLVWPDAHVEEIGLERNISLLWKALGGEGAESRFIETLPKRGYRFLAEEQPADPSAVRRSARRSWWQGWCWLSWLPLPGGSSTGVPAMWPLLPAPAWP
jgi:DNA-binding winged helix-turn-helix (wHTH) protein